MFNEVAVEFVINVVPSPETNSHEVVFLGGGRDLIRSIDDGMMGLDPDDILIQPSPLLVKIEPHIATVARCGCGEVGCGSMESELVCRDASVIWSIQHHAQSFTFNLEQYAEEVERALTDMSWETPDRTAARLIRVAADRDALARNGFRFSWASGRARQGKMSVSLFLEPGPYQVLIHSPWTGQDPQAIAAILLNALRDSPYTWADVEYYPQAQGLGAPSIAGPRWRRATS